jgi:hypothetical protein
MLKIVLKVFHFDFQWIGMCKTRQGRLNLECQEDNSSTRDSWETSICLMRASSPERVEALFSPPVFAQDVVARADNMPTLRYLHPTFRFSSQMKWWRDRNAGFLTSWRNETEESFLLPSKFHGLHRDSEFAMKSQMQYAPCCANADWGLERVRPEWQVQSVFFVCTEKANDL